MTTQQIQFLQDAFPDGTQPIQNAILEITLEMLASTDFLIDARQYLKPHFHYLKQTVDFLQEVEAEISKPSPEECAIFTQAYHALQSTEYYQKVHTEQKKHWIDGRFRRWLESENNYFLKNKKGEI